MPPKTTTPKILRRVGIKPRQKPNSGLARAALLETRSRQPDRVLETIWKEVNK